MIWIVLVLLAFLGGVLYRLGGTEKRNSWYDFLINTKARDFGIPLISMIVLVVLGKQYHLSMWEIISFLFTFLIIFGVQTTYFKKKGTDAKWYHWMLVGLANGLALFPYAWTTGYWTEFFIRTILLSIFIPVWCTLVKWDVLSEVGRGVVIILTLGLFLRRRDGKKTNCK